MHLRPCTRFVTCTELHCKSALFYYHLLFIYSPCFDLRVSADAFQQIEFSEMGHFFHFSFVFFTVKKVPSVEIYSLRKLEKHTQKRKKKKNVICKTAKSK